MRTIFTVLVLLKSLAPITAFAENEEGFELPYHLSIIIADTYVGEENDNPTIGIDFEYRVNQVLGIGAVLERAWGGLDATTVLAVADIHIRDGWVVQVGPGFEHRRGEEIFVARAGILYEFEWANFTLSPQLHWDYHNGEENALVAGVALGFSF